jgi:hypothetical protein
MVTRAIARAQAKEPMTRPQVRIEKIVEKCGRAPQSAKFSFIKIEMSYPDPGLLGLYQIA